MPKRSVGFLLLLLLVLDTAYSFVQHLHLPLDGDLAGIVMPHEMYRQVLADPFGLAVLLRDEVYNAPNRFFAHAALSGYFKHVPLLLQVLVSPIDSVYWASAIFKTLTQLGLIALLAAYITRSGRVLSGRFLVAALLVTPLFHASGYNIQMGIIDKASTYTAFYALPLGLLGLFFLPFYRAASSRQPPRPGVVGGGLLLALAVVLSLSGPLVAPVVLLVCPVALARLGWQRFQAAGAGPGWRRTRAALGQLPGAYLFFFGFISLLCLYSYYIGLNNAENLQSTISLSARYARLPLGLFYELTVKPGLPLLLLAIALNIVLMRRYAPSAAADQLLAHFKWLAMLAGFYVLLLPLGGYRDYRPYIIRYDTFQPVVLALVYAFGASSYYLLSAILPRFKRRYTIGLVGLLTFYTLADKPTIGANDCEKQALRDIASSPDKVAVINADCTIMRWGKITGTYDSETVAELLAYWGITSEKKLFYQRPGVAW